MLPFRLFHASVMVKVMKEWMEHPYEKFDRLAGSIPAPAPVVAEIPAKATA